MIRVAELLSNENTIGLESKSILQDISSAGAVIWLCCKKTSEL
jgi:hypothetical protein